MGRNLSIVSDPQKEFIFSTDETISAAGDLLINLASGKVVKPYSDVPIGLEVNNTATLSNQIASGDVFPGANTNYGQTEPLNDQAIALGDGTFVVGMTGNGSNATTSLKIYKKNAMLGDAVTVVTVDAAASQANFKLLVLDDSTFAVVWLESSTLHAIVYNNDFSVNTAEITFGTISSASYLYWDVDVLSNGDIVAAWTESTTTMVFRRYNKTLTLQGSQTTVEASSTPNHPRVTPLDNGGFVISYRNTVALLRKFARYNSSGTLQGSLTSITGSSGDMQYGPTPAYGIGLGDSGFVLQYGDASTDPYLNVYDSGGTLLRTVSVMSTTANSDRKLQGLTRYGDGFVLCAYDDDSGSAFEATICFFSKAGIMYAQYPIDLAVAASDDVVNHGALMREIPGIGVVCVLHTDGAVGYIDIMLVNESTGLVGSVVHTALGLAGKSIGLAVGKTGITYVQYFDSVPEELTYNLGLKAPIGVSLEASSSNKIRVGTRGNYTLNSEVLAAATFNATTNTVQGTKGVINDNKAILYGVDL